MMKYSWTITAKKWDLSPLLFLQGALTKVFETFENELTSFAVSFPSNSLSHSISVYKGIPEVIHLNFTNLGFTHSAIEYPILWFDIVSDGPECDTKLDVNGYVNTLTVEDTLQTCNFFLFYLLKYLQISCKYHHLPSTWITQMSYLLKSLRNFVMLHCHSPNSKLGCQVYYLIFCLATRSSHT